MTMTNIQSLIVDIYFSNFLPDIDYKVGFSCFSSLCQSLSRWWAVSFTSFHSLSLTHLFHSLIFFSLFQFLSASGNPCWDLILFMHQVKARSCCNPYCFLVLGLFCCRKKRLLPPVFRLEHNEMDSNFLCFVCHVFKLEGVNASPRCSPQLWVFSIKLNEAHMTLCHIACAFLIWVRRTCTSWKVFWRKHDGLFFMEE